jgi:WD40 repeat protein
MIAREHKNSTGLLVKAIPLTVFLSSLMAACFPTGSASPSPSPTANVVPSLPGPIPTRTSPAATLPAVVQLSTQVVLGVAGLDSGSYILLIRELDSLGSSRALTAYDAQGNLAGDIAIGPFSAAALSTDLTMLAVVEPLLEAADISDVRVIDTRTDKDVSRATALGHIGQTLSWSPDGRTLLFDMEGDLRAYDVATGDMKTIIDCDLIVEDADCRNVAWSPDGEAISFLVTISGSGFPEAPEGVYLLNASCIHDFPKCQGTIRGPLSEGVMSSWSPDGTTLATLLRYREIELLGAPAFETVQTLTIPDASAAPAFHIVWSPNGTLIAYDQGCSIQVLSLDTGTANTLTMGDAFCETRFFPMAWIVVPE